MPSTFSTGRAHLEKPSNGSDVDTWDVPINSNADVIDACLSNTTTVTISNVNVSLNQAQMQSARIAVQGTLTGDVTISFLAGISGYYIVTNATSGGPFVITLAQTSGVTVTLGSGSVFISVDGANVVLGDGGGIQQVVSSLFLPPGMIADFGFESAPAGWLLCNGANVSRATYAPLFANIGTLWGIGNGVTTFTLPNLQGYFRRTWDQSNIVDPGRAFASLQTDLFKAHAHGTNESPHTHTVPVVAGVNQSGFNNSSPLTGGGVSVTTSGSLTGLTIQNTGGAETRPLNIAVLTCIKT